eukprot:jgi/Tetstr1/431652/TSEL_021181.t1
MPDGEEPVVEPTLESLHADVKAQSTVLRELATALAQLTARERVVDGEGAHGSGSGQRIAGKPTCSGGAAERPDLLELAQSGRVGAKSVSDEDDYLAGASVDEDVAVDAGVAAKVSTSDGVGRLSSELLELCEATFRYSRVRLNHPHTCTWRPEAVAPWAASLRSRLQDAFGSDELGQRTLDLLSSSLTAQTLKSYAGRLSQFAEFCHDPENISPLEATTAIVVRYVAGIGEQGHIGAKTQQPYLSAINTFFELHSLNPIAKDSLHLIAARRGLMLRQRRLEAAPLRVASPADVAYSFVEKAELIVSAPTTEYLHDFRALVPSVVIFMLIARGLTGVSCRVRDVHVDDYNITL